MDVRVAGDAHLGYYRAAWLAEYAPKQNYKHQHITLWYGTSTNTQLWGQGEEIIFWWGSEEAFIHRGWGLCNGLNSSHEYGRFQPGLGAPTKGRVNSAAPYAKPTGALLLVWKQSEEMRKVVKNSESLVQFDWSRTKSLIAANNSVAPAPSPRRWFPSKAAPQELHLFSQLSVFPTDLA